MLVPDLVTAFTTTPDDPPNSAVYWCVSTWNSAIESSVMRACGPVPPPSVSWLAAPSTLQTLLAVVRPFTLKLPPSNSPGRKVGHEAGHELHQRQVIAALARQAVDLPRRHVRPDAARRRLDDRRLGGDGDGLGQARHTQGQIHAQSWPMSSTPVRVCVWKPESSARTVYVPGVSVGTTN